jgi:glucokinase
MTTAIGIDLGGTNIKGVLLNAGGEVIHQLTRATEPGRASDNGNGQHWKQGVSQMIRELKSKSVNTVEAIGISAPGLPNEDNSAIRVMPARLDGLENLIWADYLNEPAVWVLNDAHAALIAEARFGVGQGIKNIVMLTLGTGVGGAVLINGELYQGNYQMAGHLGHMIVNVDNEDSGIVGLPGTLENAVGDATVLKRSFGKIKSTHELVKAYQQGDSFATFIWLNTVRKLALGLCSLCNFLSPELIILGGGITKAGDALYKPLSDFIDVYEWKNTGKKTPIKQAGYDEMAGAVGAAGFAFNKVTLVS